MNKEVLIALLKVTKGRVAELKMIAIQAGVPEDVVTESLLRLEESGLIRQNGRLVSISKGNRIKIAVQAVRLGADFERVCRLLEWKEFEAMSTKTFEAFDYHVARNFRFKAKDGKRWEIDLLAKKRSLIVSVDCKHWRYNWTKSPIMRIVEEHTVRTKAFANMLPVHWAKYGMSGWSSATVVPIILSLLPTEFKLHDNTPVVSITQMQSFLNELPGHVGSLTHFHQKPSTENQKITRYLKQTTSKNIN